MKKFLLGIILFLNCFCLTSQTLNIQPKVYNLPCGVNCANLSFKIPDLRTTEDYVIRSTPFMPQAFTSPGGNELTSLYVDDKYSAAITVPFASCMYGQSFTQFIVGSNGIISFDLAYAGCNNAYVVNQDIPYEGAFNCSVISSARYPKFCIMSPYHDIDPSITAITPGRKIEWRVDGVAPFRKLVINFYEIGLFGTGCSNDATKLCTSQIVVNESTSEIFVYIGKKETCTSWQAGRAILGIQKDATLALPVPGHNATDPVWSESNTAYLFKPNGNTALLQNVVITKKDGTLVGNGIISPATNDSVTISYNNYCVTGSGPDTLVVKANYIGCDPAAPFQLVDTIYVVKNPGDLLATGTVIPAICTASNGSIIVNVPAGAGTAPFQYSINGGSLQNSNTFTGLATGSYTIFVKDAGGTCTSTFTIFVGITNPVTLTAVTSLTSCAGVSNGSITINATNATNPIQYSINNGPYQSSNVYTGLAAGTYSIKTLDGNGCQNLIFATVNDGAGISATVIQTPVSCSGAMNGVITITNPSGSAPHEYALDAGAFQSGNIFNGVTQGIHTVKVKDASGCIYTTTITVGIGAGITATVTQTPTTCAGVNNGIITITNPTGTGPHEYALDAGAYQAGNIFNAVSSGVHTVKVKDANGCVYTTTINVTNGAGITATVTQTPTTCAGVNNGVITITNPTGTGPHEYALDAGAYQIGNIFNGVSTGVHTVKVKDAIGCVYTTTINVTAGSGITATVTQTPASCTGINNGIITITNPTGSAPHEYTVDALPYQAGNVFNGLASGSHTVNVKDAAGCIYTTTVNITSLPGVSSTAVATNTACAGVNNGTITVSNSAGQIPFQYSINGGPGQASNIFTGLAAATYTILVTDGAGCTASFSMPVAQGTGFTATHNTVATSCTGINNGSITLTPNGGATPYSYVLDGGIPQSSNIFNNVSAGPHTVLITDNLGCTYTQNVIVTAGTVFSLTQSSTPATCATALNGTVSIVVNGGSSPYSYVLDGGTPQSNGNFSNVSAGLHTVFVTDNSGCSNSVALTVGTGTGISATAISTATTCNGATNGTITITPSLGTAPYQYQLNAGAFQNSNAFTGLAAGPYTITIKDFFNCSFVLTATVTQGTDLTATTINTDVLCNGGNTGSITVANTNGNPPYQYSLNGGAFQSAALFSNLIAGNYTIGLRDGNNCTGVINVSISEPTVLNLNLTTTAVLCNGQNNGTITATGSGGIGNYTYSLDGVTYQAGNLFNIVAGNYTVYIKDANGCIKTATTTVAQPAVLQLSATAVNASCNGGADGVITANASGGATPYSYSLNGTTFQPGNTFNVLPGNYTLTVKDANNCTNTFLISVGLTSNILVSTRTDTTICESNSVRLVTLSNATSYSWTPSIGLDSVNIKSPVATPLVTTQYIVTATLGNCSRKDTVNIIVNPAPIADAGLGTIICSGKSYTLQGSGGIAYRWLPASSLNNANIQAPVATPTVTTVYSLMVTDNNGCSSVVPDTVTVGITPPIVVSAGPDTIIVMGQAYPLNTFITNPSIPLNQYSYIWSPAFGLSNATIANPVATISADQIYNVEVATPEGCKGNANVTLKVFKGPDIYVPTGFTPNGDGKNDVFRVITVGIKQFDYLRVFNRFGQKIFETKDPKNGWEGKFKSTDQPSGAYIFNVQGVTDAGKVINKKGTIIIAR